MRAAAAATPRQTIDPAVLWCGSLQPPNVVGGIASAHAKWPAILRFCASVRFSHVSLARSESEGALQAALSGALLSETSLGLVPFTKAADDWMVLRAQANTGSMLMPLLRAMIKACGLAGTGTILNSRSSCSVKSRPSR